MGVSRAYLTPTEQERYNYLSKLSPVARKQTNTQQEFMELKFRDTIHNKENKQ